MTITETKPHMHAATNKGSPSNKPPILMPMASDFARIRLISQPPKRSIKVIIANGPVTLSFDDLEAIWIIVLLTAIRNG